jgi:hypothetical protein
MSDHTIHFHLTLKDPNNPLYLQSAGGGSYVPKDIASRLFYEVETLIKTTINSAVKEHREQNKSEKTHPIAQAPKARALRPR